MKSIFQVLVLSILACGSQIFADENSSGSPNDPVILKGKITCAKSELNDSPTCHTVIVVRNNETNGDGNNGDNKDDVVYYFDEASSKKYHKMICEQGVNGSVMGTVTEKNGVKSIKVTKLAWKSQGDLK
jgi:hypothetical protein